MFHVLRFAQKQSNNPLVLLLHIDDVANPMQVCISKQSWLSHHIWELNSRARFLTCCSHMHRMHGTQDSGDSEVVPDHYHIRGCMACGIMCSLRCIHEATWCCNISFLLRSIDQVQNSLLADLELMIFTTTTFFSFARADTVHCVDTPLEMKVDFSESKVKVI